MTPPDSGESEPNLPCPHARPSWRMCPHCLGINGPPLPVEAYLVPRDNEPIAIIPLHLAQRILAALEQAAWSKDPVPYGEFKDLASELHAVVERKT